MRKLLACLFISIQCFKVTTTVAQNNSTLDTLVNTFEQVNTDKYDSLIHSFYIELKDLNISQATRFMNYVVRLDAVDKHYRAKINAYIVLAKLSNHSSKNAHAIAQANNGFKIAEINKDTLLMAHVQMRKAGFYQSFYSFDKAAESYHYVIDLLVGSQYHRPLANAYSALTNLEYNHIGVGTEVDRNNVVKHTSLAIEELRKADFVNERDRTFAIMSAYNTLGLAYREADYDKAIYYFINAENFAKKINNTFWISLINGNMASIYAAKGKLDTALMFVKLDRNNSIEMGQWGSAINAIIVMGDIYVQKDMLSKALSSYEEAENLIIEHNESLTSKRSLYKSYADYYVITNQWEKAHKFRNMYFEVRDSLAAVFQKQKIREAQVNFEFNQQKADVEMLSQNNELLSKKIEFRNYLFFVGIIFVVVMGTFLFILQRQYREKKILNKALIDQNEEIESQNEELTTQSDMLEKQNLEIQSYSNKLERKVKKRTQQLKKSNTELDTFLYRASHDIRGPISSILGLYELSKITTDRQEMTHIIAGIGITARHMDVMLGKMKSIYFLFKETYNSQEILFDELIDDFSAEYKEEISKLNINIETDITHQFPIYADLEIIKMIVFNIAENSVLFHNPNIADKSIKISTQNTADKDLYIIIKDNGIGIHADYFERIFDSYFRGDSISKGNGLGLFIAKRAALTLGGSIAVVSTFGEGSTFTISIPHG